MSQKYPSNDISMVTSAFAGAGLAFAFADTTGRIMSANPALVSLFGFTQAEEILGRFVTEFAYDSDQLQEVTNGLHTGGKWAGTLAVCRRDGTPVHVLVGASKVLNSAGVVLGSIGSFVDVSNQWATDDIQRRVRRAFLALAESRAAVIEVADPAALLCTFCRILVEVVDYQLAWIGVAEHNAGRTVRPVAYAGTDQGYIDTLQISWGEGERGWGPTGRAIHTRRPAVNQDVLRNPDFGPWRAEALKRGYQSSAAIPIRRDGRVWGALNVYAAEPHAFDEAEVGLLSELARDLSHGLDFADARLANELSLAALRGSEVQIAQQARLLDKIQGLARIGGWELDFNTGELIWTAGTHHIHDTTPAEYSPALDSAIAFYSPASQPIIAAALEAARLTGTGWDLDLEMVTAKGRPIQVRAVGETQREGAQIRKVFGAIQDVTERRMLEAQFLQAQKLEAIGKLSSGIAHDFNNLLTVIGVNASLLDDIGSLTPEQREEVADIKGAVSRASSLTRQLLTYSRQLPIVAVEVDLNTSVNGVIQMLRRVIGAEIELVTSYAEQSLLLRADPGMLDQIILNLVVNARDAMPRGGRLTITTSAAEINAAGARLSGHEQEGSFGCLTVADSGAGIPPEILPRVFEPFFTTKVIGKGSGLGLATVHSIVQQHNGWSTLESELGRGTTFRVYLPLLA